MTNSLQNSLFLILFCTAYEALQSMESVFTILISNVNIWIDFFVTWERRECLLLFLPFQVKVSLKAV